MKTFLAVCVLAMAIASPALAQKVSVEYGHQEDFSKYSTYRWGKNKGELPDKTVDGHIKNKIGRLLEARGLHPADSGNADLVVSYQATEKSQQEVDSYADDSEMGLGVGWGWGMGWGMGWGDMSPSYAVNQVTTLHKGDLLVDMVDPSTKRVVFRGYANGAFHSDPIREDKLMTKALDKMFKNFPPKHK